MAFRRRIPPLFFGAMALLVCGSGLVEASQDPTTVRGCRLALLSQIEHLPADHQRLILAFRTSPARVVAFEDAQWIKQIMGHFRIRMIMPRTRGGVIRILGTVNMGPRESALIHRLSIAIEDRSALTLIPSEMEIVVSRLIQTKPGHVLSIDPLPEGTPEFVTPPVRPVRPTAEPLQPPVATEVRAPSFDAHPVLFGDLDPNTQYVRAYSHRLRVLSDSIREALQRRLPLVVPRSYYTALDYLAARALLSSDLNSGHAVVTRSSTTEAQTVGQDDILRFVANETERRLLSRIKVSGSQEDGLARFNNVEQAILLHILADLLSR